MLRNCEAWIAGILPLTFFNGKFRSTVVPLVDDGTALELS